MLGGGNPVGGSNPSGTGTSVNYVGNHCYAYSGDIVVEDSSNAGTTLIGFTTGNRYIIAQIHVFNDQANALDDYIHVKIDGQLIIKARYQNAAELHQDQPTQILIPPYAKFELNASANDSPVRFTAVLSGRVYG
jgi:hypothetical protein